MKIFGNQILCWGCLRHVLQEKKMCEYEDPESGGDRLDKDEEKLPRVEGIHWHACGEQKTLHEYLYLMQLESYKTSEQPA